jgi:hypothetical protein
VNDLQRRLPNPERISVLAGTIILVYLLTPYVSLPAIEIPIRLPGVFLPLELNFRTLVSIIVAALTATGADWLLREHPAYRGGITAQHWLLPALTAWVIGSVLYTIPLTPIWWAALAVGSLVLTLVLVAEYIALDPQDRRYPIAVAGLAALAFGLFLALTITLHAAGMRLFLRLPFIAGSAGLVTFRVLSLRGAGHWPVWETITMLILSGQIAASLHYWPISNISYGLALLAPLYASINYLAALQQGLSPRRALFEPLSIGGLILIAAFWSAGTG